MSYAKKKQPVSDLDKSLQEVLGINITLEHSHLSLIPSHPCSLMSENESGKVSEFSCHALQEDKRGFLSSPWNT